jgi:hypothetical protein
MKMLKHCLLNLCELFLAMLKINPSAVYAFGLHACLGKLKKIKLKACGRKSRYTSSYVGGATGEQIPTSFDIFSESADIINISNRSVCRSIHWF